MSSGEGVTRGTCAAAGAVIETMERERTWERAASLGAKLMERACGWQDRWASLADVRGLGLMIGLEFLHPDGSPDAEVVEAVRAAALRRDLLLLACGTDENVIRLVPPLTIPEDDLATGLRRLEESLAEVAG